MPTATQHGPTKAHALDVKLERVHIQTSQNNPAATESSYYWTGTTEIDIGGRPVSFAVGCSFAFEKATPDRLRGQLFLPELEVKASFEAYK